MAFARVRHLLHLPLSRLPVASVYVLASQGGIRNGRIQRTQQLGNITRLSDVI